MALVLQCLYNDLLCIKTGKLLPSTKIQLKYEYLNFISFEAFSYENGKETANQKETFVPTPLFHTFSLL